MNIITLCSIEKVTDGYKVRYLRGNKFCIARFGFLVDAMEYAEKQLHADRTEVLLSITNNQ